MKKARLITNGGHFLLLQLLWPAAVLGAAAGMVWPVAATLAAMLCWTMIRRADIQADLRLVVAGILVGLIFELLLIGSGLIIYEMQRLSGAPPLWILLLWAGFTLNFRHCMAWFQSHRVAAALLGLLGAPFSVAAGVALDAAVAPAGITPLMITYGLAWALVMPLLASLAASRAGQDAGGRETNGRSVAV